MTVLISLIYQTNMCKAKTNQGEKKQILDSSKRLITAVTASH
jgi:hypothetical protein